jgi:hypothetical protein
VSLPLVDSSAKAASELEAEAKISEKLDMAGALGGAGGKPVISLKTAVIEAVFIKSPECRLVSARIGSSRAEPQFPCQRTACL